MNCARDFIITSKGLINNGLIVWQGRSGWKGISEDYPGRITSGWVYKTERAASKAIDRMRAKYPNDDRWIHAGYCTLDEATADDNPLGIDWSVEGLPPSEAQP